MTIKNESGNTRNVKELFKVNKDKKTYIVYQDYNTGNIYGGLLDDNKLNKLDEKEFQMLNEIYEKMRVE